VKEIRLKPGRYLVKANKDGKTVSEELVRIERNGKQLVRVRREANPSLHPDAAEWEKSVVALPAEEQVKAVAARLKQLNPGFDGAVTPTFNDGRVTGLHFSPVAVKDLSPVRALTGLISLDCRPDGQIKGLLADLSPLKGMKLTSLNCMWTQVSDLSPLEGMPLTTLTCSVTSVSDLSSLRGMPLTHLHCDHTPVSDLSPLAGMRLATLNCSYTRVSSLEPLRGMPLIALWCNHTQLSDLSPLKEMRLEWITLHGTKVGDLSPLKGMPLTKIYLDFDAKRDGELLRSLPTLEQINDKPVAEFWKERDAKPD
jgi:hypothetical protein